MRPYAGRPSKVWTDEMVERARVVLGRHRTLKDAAAELGVSASGLQSAFWARREQLGGGAREFLFGGALANHSEAPKGSTNSSAGLTGSTQPQPAVTDCAPARVVEHKLPPVAPVTPPPPMSTGTARVRRPVERILFIPDVHVPFEDPRAWDLMLTVARALRPEHIVILGDFADMWAASSHDKSPSRRDNLESEMRAVAARLDELDALGARTRVYCEGNHEERLSRYITQRAPELFDFVSFPKIQRLAERGWAWIPYREHHRIGKVFVTHDLGQAGIYAAARARATMGGNVVIGHVHRMGVHYASTAEGTGHVSASFGWLGDATQAKYLPAAKRAEWQLGFGLGYMEPETGHVHMQAVPIVDYRCVVEGALFGRAAA